MSSTTESKIFQTFYSTEANWAGAFHSLLSSYTESNQSRVPSRKAAATAASERRRAEVGPAAEFEPDEGSGRTPGGAVGVHRSVAQQHSLPA